MRPRTCAVQFEPRFEGTKQTERARANVKTSTWRKRRYVLFPTLASVTTDFRSRDECHKLYCFENIFLGQNNLNNRR